MTRLPPNLPVRRSTIFRYQGTLAVVSAPQADGGQNVPKLFLLSGEEYHGWLSVPLSAATLATGCIGNEGRVESQLTPDVAVLPNLAVVGAYNLGLHTDESPKLKAVLLVRVRGCTIAAVRVRVRLATVALTQPAHVPLELSFVTAVCAAARSCGSLCCKSYERRPVCGTW